MDNVKLLEKINNQKEDFFSEISKIIVGQKDVIEHIFIAMLCKGHILLEGVPGLGKTLIIKTISDIMDLNDPIIEIEITPNRGDCLGVRGIARDLAAAGMGNLKDLEIIFSEGEFDRIINFNICSIALNISFK